MSFNFPEDPTSGQHYTFGDVTWRWNGYAWERYDIGVTGATGATGETGATGPYGIVGDYVESLNGLTGAVINITTNLRGWFFL